MRSDSTSPSRHSEKTPSSFALNDPKAKKDMFVKLLEAFANAGSYKLAAVAGETACKMDPSDGELQQKVRNMLAQSTMTSGGYDDKESGGFRKNIRDADKQLKLEQEDSVAKPTPPRTPSSSGPNKSTRNAPTTSPRSKNTPRHSSLEAKARTSSRP